MSGKYGVFHILGRFFHDAYNEQSSHSTQEETVYNKMLKHVTEDIVSSKEDVPEILRQLLEPEESFLELLEKTMDESPIITHLKRVTSAVHNVVLVGLQKYAAHNKLRYVFFKSDVYKSLIRVFLEKDSSDEMATILELIYIGFQANNNCEKTEKEFMKDALNQIDRTKRMIFVRNMLARLNVLDDTAVEEFVKSKLDELINELEKREKLDELKKIDMTIRTWVTNILDSPHMTHKNAAKEYLKDALGEIDAFSVDTHKELQSKLDQLAKTDENKELDNVNLIALSISKVYFDEKGECCSTLRKWCRSFENCFSKYIRLYHKCIVRGYFALFPCLLRIGFHVSDFVSDMAVGVEIIYEYSKELGSFILSLAVFTLFHENIRSVHRQYETEKELLRAKLGKFKIEIDDWDNESDLYYHKGKWFLRWLWPFRVNSSKGYLKPIVFNLFSMFLLRPVVDRLIVLTHHPTNLRTIYSQKSRERSLNQHYMTLEQIPELLVQFYVLQIFSNNIFDEPTATSPVCLENGTTHTFNYSSQYFVCSTNYIGSFLKIDTCASYWLLIFSMILPFVKIPGGMVCLEEMFRKLDPYTLKMSAVSSWLLYTIYILMIPSRLFLYAGVMHAVPQHLYVVLYIFLATVVWFSLNVYWLLIKEKEGEKQQYQIQSCIKRIRNFVSKYLYVSLFSFRDIWVISLRDPNAYICSTSKVSYDSLRSWKKIMAISTYYFIEGLAGAVIIQEFYPCGMNSHIFKYQGWFLLILCIISTSNLIIQSYVLQPRLKNTLWRKFVAKSAVVFSFVFVLSLLAAVTFVVKTFIIEQTVIVLIAIVVPLAIVAILYALATLCLKQFGEAKKKDNKEESSSDLRSPRASSYLCCCPDSSTGDPDYSAVKDDETNTGSANAESLATVESRKDHSGTEEIELRTLDGASEDSGSTEEREASQPDATERTLLLEEQSRDSPFRESVRESKLHV